jgi:murein DD-endopeptidase MepM/ murein hydrolase activator NlpD
MSNSAASFHLTAEQGAGTRAQAAAAGSHRMQRNHTGYVLQHCGRHVRIGPIAFWTVVGTLVVMAAWSVLTGTYFVFHEDVLTGLIGRQAKLRSAYEDRIAELRDRIDRITSRQLLDQQQFERKLTALLQRQATLKRRTDAVAGDELATGSIPSSQRALTGEDQRLRLPPTSDTIVYLPLPDRVAPLHSRKRPHPASQVPVLVNAGRFENILAHVSASLDRIAHRQILALSNIEERVDSKARNMHNVLSDLSNLGVHVGKIPRSAIGGPLVPIKPPLPGASAFDRQLYRVDIARAKIDRYNHVLAAVPVRKPVGFMDITSPFGIRRDPFLGTSAMHTGIDLRGEIGTPVHATADGTVKNAGWDGGYGNLVEIDHGNGTSTYYGHLSQIDVTVGQIIHAGQIIGKIGSTGRSTGPHLHYETRIDGEPINPQKLLRAGLQLGKI